MNIITNIVNNPVRTFIARVFVEYKKSINVTTFMCTLSTVNLANYKSRSRTPVFLRWFITLGESSRFLCYILLMKRVGKCITR